MIKLRLQRKGRKKRPFYHIVVADSRSPRDGRIIERLGRFDNVSEKQELTYDEERIIHWLKIGAQPSDTVRSILKKEGILLKMHLERWGKSEEEIQAALEEWRAARESKTGDVVLNKKEQQKAQLKAEEQEFKKQLEEKAAAAAKALEKKKEAEAKAESEEESAEETTEAKSEETTDDTEAVKEEETAEVEKEAEAKAEVEEEPAKEKAPETAEAEVEEPEEAKAKEEKTAETEEADQPKAKAEVVEEDAAETEEPVAEEKTEAPKAEKKNEKDAEATSEQVSTDMNATEAIDHIKNSSVDELDGFVPKDEERVTVQRAWESKQAE